MCSLGVGSGVQRISNVVLGEGAGGGQTLNPPIDLVRG